MATRGDVMLGFPQDVKEGSSPARHSRSISSSPAPEESSQRPCGTHARHEQSVPSSSHLYPVGRLWEERERRTVPTDGEETGWRAWSTGKCPAAGLARRVRPPKRQHGWAGRLTGMADKHMRMAYPGKTTPTRTHAHRDLDLWWHTVNQEGGA